MKDQDIICDTKENNIENASSDNFLEDIDQSQKTYGTIYTPSEEGKSYSCQRYSVNSQQESLPCESDSTEIGDNKNYDKRKKKNSGNLFGVVAITVAFCVMLSSVAIFGIVALTNGIWDFSDYPSDTAPGLGENSAPQNNQVFIDYSQYPDYSIETVAPGEIMSMENAIAAVKDSVVEITTETVENGFGGFSQYVVSGAGSGVIVSTGGYIITNNHVIEGAENIKVSLSDGTEYDAELVGTDAMTDIAVLLIAPEEGKKLLSATIGSGDGLLLGQTVIAIGNPLGELGGTVTDGIISSLARDVMIEGSGTMTLLQTNAAVSPGNSGGGLFDLYGRLIGIVNAKSTGEGIEGISFAIPISTAWDIAEQLIEKGYVSGRPSLGVVVKQVQYGIMGFAYTAVVVEDVNGVDVFKDEDRIFSINGVEITAISQVSQIINNYEIGDVVEVTVIRDKRYVDLKVTLTEYVPQSAVNGTLQKPRS